jgi:hypothetical protein
MRHLVHHVWLVSNVACKPSAVPAMPGSPALLQADSFLALLFGELFVSQF